MISKEFYVGLVGAVGFIFLIGLLLAPSIYNYYKAIGVDPVCMEAIAKSFCDANNYTFISNPNAEKFYCMGEYNERLSPEGIRMIYYFTEEEQQSCKVKEQNSWRSFK